MLHLRITSDFTRKSYLVITLSSDPTKISLLALFHNLSRSFLRVISFFILVQDVPRIPIFLSPGFYTDRFVEFLTIFKTEFREFYVLTAIVLAFLVIHREINVKNC